MARRGSRVSRLRCFRLTGVQLVMRHLIATSVALTLFATATLTSQPAYAADPGSKVLVEFELMTWPEVRDALAAGKTTALIYTGGVEQRGPRNVNGGANNQGPPARN